MSKWPNNNADNNTRKLLSEIKDPGFIRLYNNKTKEVFDKLKNERDKAKEVKKKIKEEEENKKVRKN